MCIKPPRRREPTTSTTQTQEAHDRLVLAARASKRAAPGDVETGARLQEAIRGALHAGVPQDRVRQITNLPIRQIRALRPRTGNPQQPPRRARLDTPDGSGPRAESWPPNVVQSREPETAEPVVWTTEFQRSLMKYGPPQAKSSSQSVWAIPSGLPGLGKRR